MNAGKSWVGEGYKTLTDKAGNVIGYSSRDGMKSFRIQFKQNEGMWRANFTQNVKALNQQGAEIINQLKNSKRCMVYDETWSKSIQYNL